MLWCLLFLVWSSSLCAEQDKNFVSLDTQELLYCQANMHDAKTQKKIQNIEEYINKLSSLKCTFEQQDQYAAKQSQYPVVLKRTGTFYMKKKTPSKKQKKESDFSIRIDLPPEQKIFILHDMMKIYDMRTNKMCSKANLMSTPIVYIFSGDFSIKKNFKPSLTFCTIPNQDDVFGVLLQPKAPNTPDIMLFFKTDPKTRKISQLAGWVITDMRRHTIYVKISTKDYAVNTKIPSQVFMPPSEKEPSENAPAQK